MYPELFPAEGDSLAVSMEEADAATAFSSQLFAGRG